MKMKDYLALHKQNRQHVRTTITRLECALNLAIRRGEIHSANIQVRCLTILWIAYLEVSLCCILHSANQLTYSERRAIAAKRTLVDKWRSLLDSCFRKYYMSSKQKAFTKLSLGTSHFHRFSELKTLLEDDIAPLIEVRNRLAHGQWHIAFNNEGTCKSQDLTSHIWRISKKDTLFMRSLGHNFVVVMTELTCSRGAFEKKFDGLLRKIEDAREHRQEKYDLAMKRLKASQAYKESLGYF